MDKWFWKWVNKNGPIHPICGQCWVWTGATDKDGYGKVKHNREHLRTHRVAYQLVIGEIPDGMMVLHECDNPTCVEPSHLFLGTVQDNNDDMNQKGRGKSCPGDLNGSRLHPERLSRGEKHGSLIAAKCPRGTTHYKSRFTKEDIRSIRARVAAGVTQAAIVIEYGSSPPVICRIVSRQSYTDVV